MARSKSTLIGNCSTGAERELVCANKKQNENAESSGLHFTNEQNKKQFFRELHWETRKEKNASQYMLRNNMQMFVQELYEKQRGKLSFVVFEKQKEAN